MLNPEYLNFAKADGITGGKGILERKTGSLSGAGLSLIVGELTGEYGEVASLKKCVSL